MTENNIINAIKRATNYFGQLEEIASFGDETLVHIMSDKVSYAITVYDNSYTVDFETFGFDLSDPDEIADIIITGELEILRGLIEVFIKEELENEAR